MLPHQKKTSKKGVKTSFYKYCECCDYTASQKFNWDRHILTNKHIKKALKNVDNPLKKRKKKRVRRYICELCGCEYKDRSGLWRHKKICIIDSESEEEEEKKETKPDKVLVDKELFSSLVELLKNGTHNTNNTNCNNTNTYNNNITVQVYLDDYCKDAKSIESIVSKLKTQVEYKLKDIAYPSNLKFIKDAPSDLFIKEMKKMPAEERPVHCADGKRGKFWVKKEEDGWVQEDVKAGGSLKTQIGVFKSNVFMDVQDDINKKGKGEDMKYMNAKGKFFKEMFEKKTVDNNIIAKLATNCNIKDAIKDIEDKQLTV